jgi:hypothetical protein
LCYYLHTPIKVQNTRFDMNTTATWAISIALDNTFNFSTNSTDITTFHPLIVEQAVSPLETSEIGGLWVVGVRPSNDLTSIYARSIPVTNTGSSSDIANYSFFDASIYDNRTIGVTLQDNTHTLLHDGSDLSFIYNDDTVHVDLELHDGIFGGDFAALNDIDFSSFEFMYYEYLPALDTAHVYMSHSDGGYDKYSIHSDGQLTLDVHLVPEVSAYPAEDYAA